MAFGRNARAPVGRSTRGSIIAVEEMSLNVNGLPDKGLLSDAAVFARLDPLAPPLVSHLQSRSLTVPTRSAPLDGRQLAQFVYDLGVFQEKVLGFGAARPENPGAENKSAQHPLRIPASLLMTHPSLTDFSALDTKAPLYAVLEAAFTFLGEKNESSWDMEDAQKRTLYVEMIASVRRTLRASNVLPAVRIAVTSDVTEAEATHLRGIAARIGCTFIC